MSDEADTQEDIIDEIMDETVVEDTAEEVVEEEVAAEAIEEAAVEDARTVPLAALHEARQQNQELRESMARRDERMTMIQERLDAMAAGPAKEEIEAEIPEFIEDPAGHMEARFARMEKLLERQAEQTTTTTQRAQQNDLQRQLDSAIQADQGEFVQNHPDYADALAYERQRQLDTLMDGGLPEEQAKAAISQAEYQMASVVLTNKKSPAEVMYNAAVRSGYAPKAASTETTDETEVDLTEADSMGGSGGPSVKDLLEADSDEFDSMFEELGYGKKMQ